MQWGTASSNSSQVQGHKQSSQSPDIALAHQVRHLPHEISDQLKRTETDSISKSFRKYISNIPGNHEVKELQKTAILGTAHILRKVLHKSTIVPTQELAI